MDASQIFSMRNRIPSLQTITYYVSTISGFNNGVKIAKCESRPLTQQENLVYLGSNISRKFYVWTDQLGSIRPKDGDKLTDQNGDEWIVAYSTLELIDLRYGLMVKKAR